MTLNDILKLLSSFALLTGLGSASCIALTGCTPDSNVTVEQQAADAEAKIRIIDKFAELAEKQGVAWQSTLEVDGRPGVGAEQKFFLDTGVRLRISAAGNAKTGNMTPTN